MTAGYSGTPLVSKLGIKKGQVVALIHQPDHWSLEHWPENVTVRHDLFAPANVVIAFFRSAEALQREVHSLAEGLGSKDALWLAWPRRASGHRSDITEDLLRALLLPLGLVDVKVAALGEDWSGLKFLWRKERRASS